jgi:hypothetical protein
LVIRGEGWKESAGPALVGILGTRSTDARGPAVRALPFTSVRGVGPVPALLVEQEHRTVRLALPGFHRLGTIRVGVVTAGLLDREVGRALAGAMLNAKVAVPAPDLADPDLLAVLGVNEHDVRGPAAQVRVMPTLGPSLRAVPAIDPICGLPG